MHKAMDILLSYQTLGIMETKNGTKLVGKAPHIAPQAWLHSIFPPLQEGQIREMEKKVGLPFPEEYCTFLSLANGLNVFNGTLSLFGQRSTFERNAEENSQQPFDIIIPNTLERPPHTEDYIIIGSYDWDGSLLAVHSKQGDIIMCERYTGEVLHRWDSFAAMLCNEVPRICSLFGSDGRELDPNKSTLPCE